jgi:hypothetical protein
MISSKEYSNPTVNIKRRKFHDGSESRQTRWRRVQLWTNESKTKYAIRFENDLQLNYLATTSKTDNRGAKTQYTTLIAQSDGTLKGKDYDWKYLLNNWIKIHKFVSTPNHIRHKFIFETKVEHRYKSLSVTTVVDAKRYSLRLKPYIKCHFCRLLFDSNNKRVAHEREWHELDKGNTTSNI